MGSCWRKTPSEMGSQPPPLHGWQGWKLEPTLPRTAPCPDTAPEVPSHQARLSDEALVFTDTTSPVPWRRDSGDHGRCERANLKSVGVAGLFNKLRPSDHRARLPGPRCHRMGFSLGPLAPGIYLNLRPSSGQHHERSHPTFLHLIFLMYQVVSLHV